LFACIAFAIGNFKKIRVFLCSLFKEKVVLADLEDIKDSCYFIMNITRTSGEEL